MTDQEFKEFHDSKWKELPLELKLKAKEILLEGIHESDIKEIKFRYKQNPIKWYSFIPYHWGSSIRNYLRQNGISDNSLPNLSWIDLWVQAVEFTVGLRTE